MMSRLAFGCILRWAFVGCAIGVAVGAAPAAAGGSDLTPTHLQCEYLTDPLGIDVPVPRFSWQLADSAGARGQRQTAYEVLVASQPAMLNEDRADVWMSGKVLSAQSTLVTYAGPALKSDQDCYWKVRVSDKDGQPSQWSSVARFSVGLLAPADWKGSWIRHPTAQPEQHLWFRKELVLEEPPRAAFLHVASVGYHELYVNGRKVDDRILAPALSRLDKRVFYVTYDLGASLAKGTNVIALWTGPGWSRYAFFKTRFAVRVQLNGQTAAGKEFSLSSDATWRTQVSSSENTGRTMYTDNGGEKVDARAEVPDWNAVGFDDRAWALAAPADVAAELSAQMIEPTRILETIAAQSVTESRQGSNTVYRVDFGRNFSGWLNFRFTGLAAGDVVTIKVADDAGTAQDFGQRNVYIASGKDGEAFRNRFNYSCGRYVTLEGLKQKPALADVTGYVVGTDLRRTGRFSCSSDLFNRIYETDLWTYRCNTVEGYTSDCPHRERLGYGEENFATAWGIGLPNYASGAFYANLVRDWADVQETNGWINHTAPQINQHFGGPMWSSAGLNIAWEFYQTFGDRRVLERNYPSARRWLDFLAANVQDGLLRNYAGHSHADDWGRFLGDWAAPGQRRERGDSRAALYFNNCVYALNLETFIRIAGVLGQSNDVACYGGRLAALEQRVQPEFFDRTNHTYCGGTQVREAFALLTGVMPDDLRPTVEDTLEREFAAKPYLDMGSSGLPVLLKYLVEDSPRPDLAFEPLSKTNQPSYGYFLARGENTWPEYWNGDVASRVHTCYTGIAAWFVKNLAGIRPDPHQPGYRNCLIQPLVAGNLTFAGATVESPYGLIQSHWERKGDRLRLLVTVPPNSTATVFVPTSDLSSVTESGQCAPTADGVQPAGAHGRCAVFQVQSGRYDFGAKL